MKNINWEQVLALALFVTGIYLSFIHFSVFCLLLLPFYCALGCYHLMKEQVREAAITAILTIGIGVLSIRAQIFINSIEGTNIAYESAFIAMATIAVSLFAFLVLGLGFKTFKFGS